MSVGETRCWWWTAIRAPDLRRPRGQRVGLLQVDRDGLLHVDVDTVLEDPHAEREVELGARRDRHDVGLGLLDHRVQVGVPGVDAELVPQPVQALLDHVAKPDDLGSRVCVVGACRVTASIAASKNGDSIRFHGLITPVYGRKAGSSWRKRTPEV